MRLASQVWVSVVLLCAVFNTAASEDDVRFARLDRECFVDMPLTLAQCERYLAELEERVELDDDAKLLHAAGLSRIANFTDDAVRQSQLREQAETGLRDYLAEHPNDVPALYELSALGEPEAQIEMLKRIVKINPADTFALRQLAEELSASDKEADHLLGFQFLEQGYRETTGAERLLLGSWMYESLMGNGKIGEAVALRYRIEQDFKLEKAGLDGAPTDELIDQFCQYGFFVVGLEDACLNLIYASAADSAKLNRAYSNRMLEAIELVLSSRESLKFNFTEYAISMRDVLEDHPDGMRKSGYYYLVYSLVVSRDRRILALRTALQQGDYHEPRIRYWLANVLKEQGYIKEARIELEKVVRGDDDTLAQAAEFELTLLPEI